MDCALYELCLKPTIELVFCWHCLPRSLGVVYLHYWENTFPLFPKGFFRVFVSGEYTSNQCQPIRRTQSLRLLIMFPSWKADWVSGIFFHDLGRIHVSLFCLPRCSKVTYLGLVVLVLSLTSARIARLSPKVWLPAALAS